MTGKLKAEFLEEVASIKTSGVFHYDYDDDSPDRLSKISEMETKYAYLKICMSERNADEAQALNIVVMISKGDQVRGDWKVVSAPGARDLKLDDSLDASVSKVAIVNINEFKNWWDGPESKDRFDDQS